MIPELLLASCLAFSTNSNSFNLGSGISLASSTWDFVDEVEDGAVYFIRSAMLDSQVIDVPNSDYSDGKDVALYQSLGWANQRFAINRDSMTNRYTTYNLMPIEDYNKILSIQNENSNENNPLELRNQSAYGSNPNSYKFAFVRGSTENSFRILTGASNFTKYLTLDNYSVADNTKIVQKSFDSNYAKCFDWYLQKTDSLDINVINDAKISGTTLVHYNLRVPVSGDYIIETSMKEKAIDTRLFLYKDDGSLVDSNDDYGYGIFSRIECKLLSSQDYWLTMDGFSSSDEGDVYLTVKAKNTVYINTFYEEDNIDTRKDSVYPRQCLSNNGYYVKSMVNAARTDVLTKDGNGLDRLNNPYYMLSSHGSSSGTAVLSPGQYLYGNDLPDMSNVKLAVWAICYGGKAGNIAQYCVERKNAQYSLGFPGLTNVGTSRTFTDKLWEEISLGTSVSEAVDKAVEHTKTVHWFTHMFGWGDDTIVTPSLYSNSHMVNASARMESQINILSTLSSLSISDEDSLLLFKKKNRTMTYEFSDSTVIMKLIDGVPTNDYFVVGKSNGYIYSHLRPQFQVKTIALKYNATRFLLKNNQRKTFQNDYYLIINGSRHRIRRIQYVTDFQSYETLDEAYYDVDTNERFSFEEIQSSFLN